ncbi:hypothetical protein SBF1_2530008 [Candidatus Desulfosporosinus infrequens]|uniref:Uncharacterized protein n=1 Tax=Candidatus Desulfosporosinus infrequens TaxID=2043169 RepID=A0A2U3KPF0_9FIRM|nr:hypothetical protein SBF1_2530008 [Candidatus Desulfosporosinus infrequens]
MSSAPLNKEKSALTSVQMVDAKNRGDLAFTQKFSFFEVFRSPSELGQYIVDSYENSEEKDISAPDQKLREEITCKSDHILPSGANARRQSSSTQAGNILKQYQIEQLIEELKNQGVV